MPPLTDGNGIGRLLDKSSSIFVAIPRNIEAGSIPALDSSLDLAGGDALESQLVDGAMTLFRFSSGAGLSLHHS